MARQNKNLTDVFPAKSNNENEITKSNSNTVQKDVIQENSDQVTSGALRDTYSERGNEQGAARDEQVERGSKGAQRDESSSRTVEQVKSDLLSMFEEKTKKQTVEDTHQRTTFLFRKDLSKRLDKLAKGKRGFKTMFLNQAVEALLDEMEK
ncbi:hypothetical protein NLX67_22385 [Domibacillus sp. A3M-37]|uniref:hypothetical protein n=1 Tax=Domibacillus sp. A3M-37 TaxID=2962037 RepID=UPI0020B8B9C3|nr:hypothetical protein [Domibacillus sp. A3M-37]MCP3765055.1 hypothetical protein [Domibacillus sp. A3M-37]